MLPNWVCASVTVWRVMALVGTFIQILNAALFLGAEESFVRSIFAVLYPVTQLGNYQTLCSIKPLITLQQWKITIDNIFAAFFVASILTINITITPKGYWNAFLPLYTGSLFTCTLYGAITMIFIRSIKAVSCSIADKI